MAGPATVSRVHRASTTLSRAARQLPRLALACAALALACALPAQPACAAEPLALAAPAPAPPASAPAPGGADAHLIQIIRQVESAPEPADAADAAPGAGWDGGQVVQRVSSEASRLVLRALSFVGVRYRYGGDHASGGFDCSGLVRRVYRQTLGLILPHNAAAQSREGLKVARNQLRPGDLVFFNTLRRAFSHVGIYIGHGEFVHAPRPGQRVQVASLDSPYWAQRYDGARRLLRRAPARAEESAVGDPALPQTFEAEPWPAAALPLSNAVPANASPQTTALMAGALLPDPPRQPSPH